MREGEDVVCKENLNSPIVGSQLGRKLWYPEDSVKTSYLLASLQHLDTGAGGGDFWRLLSMLELLITVFVAFVRVSSFIQSKFDFQRLKVRRLQAR